MPSRISASVTVVVNRLSELSRTIHAATEAAGDGFIASDSTFVSNTIIAYSIEPRCIEVRGGMSSSMPPSGSTMARIAA